MSKFLTAAALCASVVANPTTASSYESPIIRSVQPQQSSVVTSVTDAPQFTKLLDVLVAEARQEHMLPEGQPNVVFAKNTGAQISRGESLHAGDKMISDNGAAHLDVQDDGNMVVYEANGHVLWSSNSGGKGDQGTHLEMQGDGNLVLYASKVLWASNTNKGSFLLMQDDCNLVLYNDDGSVGWASNTYCSGPAPGPNPPPQPAPPGPSPSSVPDVPQKPLWFGFWGSDPNAYGMSSLVWDAVSVADIDQYGSDNLRFMYPASIHFCQEGGDHGTCTLFDDYQDRWNKAVPKITQLLADKKILGFFTGDERICKSGTATPSTTMVDTIRNTFPRGKAIIWLNECTSTWPHHSMPANADWVSIDHYRKKKDDNYISDLKDLYNSNVFKKLHSHQKVLVVPGVGHPRDNYQICDDKCTAKLELKDAKDVVDWARKESRIVGIAPYAWMRDGKLEKGLNQLKDNGELKSYYENLGKSTK